MKDLLNIEFLHAFVKIAQNKEVKKTAEELFKSPSTISMQIKKLEKQLNCDLFKRTTNGLELTESGQKILPYAKNMLELNNKIYLVLDEDQLQGILKIGLPTDYTSMFLENYMPKLKKKLPKVKFEIFCSRSRILRKRIANNSLDFAFVAGERNNNDELTLWTENLQWVCGKNFILEHYKTLPIAVFNDDCLVRDLTIQSIKNSKLKFKEVISSPVLDNIAICIKNNYAISLLPEFYLNNNDFNLIPNDVIPTNETLSINLIYSDTMDVFRKKQINQILKEIKIDDYLIKK